MKEPEQSLYIIKPEGIPFSGVIRSIVERAGLVVLRQHTNVVLPLWALSEIYPDIPDEIWKATCAHLYKKKCEIVIVHGDNAVKKLVYLSGEYTDPSQCKPDTIRAMFSSKKPIPIGERWYHKNVIHRPKSVEEAKRDFLIIEQVERHID